ncbi:hypothetical protein [Duganella sp. HH101]|uniref:hypothetical protein n=1 Tax=Duganella sp. HH101 TaxID=1781066 RepID=UPI0008744C6F|nr:hypothetical protein [Duganella sp. HH101]OFA05643.1 hypothetical protein DUGA2_12220 [Duganella sp. HH101]
MQPQQEEQQKKPEDKPIAVAVITPSGVFPNDDDYRRAFESALVSEILRAAAITLQLTNTSDWVAFVDNKEIDPGQTFKHQGLHGIVEIEWHKREGGGGARTAL